MRFKVFYHPQVAHDDIPKLSTVWKNKIQKAIAERIAIRPEAYGKPLRRSLKGYRKLRVGDYRVIFLIEKNTIKIMIIQHRSIVYNRINKRI